MRHHQTGGDWPSKEVGLFDISGSVAVTTVSVLVVKAALSQNQLVLRDGLLPTEWVESNWAVGLLIVRWWGGKDNTHYSFTSNPDSFTCYRWACLPVECSKQVIFEHSTTLQVFCCPCPDRFKHQIHHKNAFTKIPDSVLVKRAALMSLSKASQALLCACSGNFPLKSSKHSRASATYLSSKRHRASRKWAFRWAGFSVRAFRQSLRAS